MEHVQVQESNAATILLIFFLLRMMNQRNRGQGGGGDEAAVALLVAAAAALVLLILLLIFMPTPTATTLRTNTLIHAELVHLENGDEIGTLYAKPTRKAYLPKDSTNAFEAEGWIDSPYKIQSASFVNGASGEQILVVLDVDQVIRIDAPEFVVDSIIVRPQFEKINIGHPPEGLIARN